MNPSTIIITSPLRCSSSALRDNSPEIHIARLCRYELADQFSQLESIGLDDDDHSISRWIDMEVVEFDRGGSLGITRHSLNQLFFAPSPVEIING